MLFRVMSDNQLRKSQQEEINNLNNEATFLVWLLNRLQSIFLNETQILSHRGSVKMSSSPTFLPQSLASPVSAYPSVMGYLVQLPFMAEISWTQPAIQASQACLHLGEQVISKNSLLHCGTGLAGQRRLPFLDANICILASSTNALREQKYLLGVQTAQN